MIMSAHDPANRRKYLSIGEGERFLKAALHQTPDRRAFCETIFIVGCRISEALALTVSDLNRHECEARFLTLKRRSIQFRDVPLPRALVDKLWALGRDSHDGKIWAFSRTTGSRVIKRVMADAAITGIQAVPKGLRHGF